MDPPAVPVGVTNDGCRGGVGGQRLWSRGCMAEKGIRVKWVRDTTPTEMASVR